MYQYQIYWQQIILGHDSQRLPFLPVPSKLIMCKNAHSWGCMYGVWGCLDGVWMVSEGVWHMS